MHFMNLYLQTLEKENGFYKRQSKLCVDIPSTLLKILLKNNFEEGVIFVFIVFISLKVLNFEHFSQF